MRITLGNWFAIYKRELQSYYTSPFAYVVTGVFWLLAGIFFLTLMNSRLEQAAGLDLQRQQFGGQIPPVDFPALILQDFLGILGSLILVLLPMLSMGLYAEERKRGTLELLATSPITNWAVALGKLLAVLTFFLGMLLPLMIYESLVVSSASPPMAPAVFLVAHLGLFLMGAGILSLGMFMSSLTSNTIVAAVMTFAVVLFLWIIDAIAQSATGVWKDFFGQLSMLRHFTNLVQGVVDSGSIAMLVSYIFLGVFLTAQAVEAFRFQRS